MRLARCCTPDHMTCHSNDDQFERVCSPFSEQLMTMTAIAITHLLTCLHLSPNKSCSHHRFSGHMDPSHHRFGTTWTLPIAAKSCLTFSQRNFGVGCNSLSIIDGSRYPEPSGRYVSSIIENEIIPSMKQVSQIWLQVGHSSLTIVMIELQQTRIWLRPARTKLGQAGIELNLSHTQTTRTHDLSCARHALASMTNTASCSHNS